MKQVQILIDSACDMQQPEAERLGCCRCVPVLTARSFWTASIFPTRRFLKS